MSNNYQELEVWTKYTDGIDFKQSIGLYKDVNDNNRFYSGNPWEGVVTNGLPVTSLPLIKRIVDHKVNNIMGDDLKINYSIDGIDDNDTSPDTVELRELSKMLSMYAMTVWETLKEDSKNEQALLDGALSGDGIEYLSWDSSINAGNGIKGNIDSEIVDNVNYFPENPNNSDVQSQPSITLAFRKMVSDLKREAKANGISKDEIEKIVSDNETDNQAGEMSKKELNKSGKCMCLLKMWKKDDKVWFNKSTRYAQITKGDVDSGLTIYPVTLFNWYRRKNCAHGVSEVKGIIPNQMAINKLTSMIILAVMHIAIPKMVYDRTRMSAPTNTIGGAIGVDGTGNGIDGVVKYITPGQLSNDIYKVVDMLIDKTKEMLAATDAALGESNMDNTSALVVLQKAAAIPLKTISRRYWQFNEDKARIFMDFFIHKYIVERTLTYSDQGIKKTFNFDGSKYGDIQWHVKIDVGASTHWSELTAIQTMTNMLQGGHMTFPQVLERFPNGIIPQKEKLLQEIDSANTDRQLMFKFLADYVEGLPPEMQMQIKSMKPEEMEARVKEMALKDSQAPPQVQQPQQSQPQPQANQAANNKAVF